MIFDMDGLSLGQTMQFTPPFAKRVSLMICSSKHLNCLIKMDVFFRLLTGFRTVCHCESRQSISSISHGSSISFLPCSSPSCGKSCGSELSSTGRIGPHFISTFLPNVSHWLMVVLWTPHASLAINGISFWSNVIQNSSRSTRTGTRTSKLYF